MKQVVVDLHIPADEFLKHYQGTAHMVHARARDGRSVNFPTGILQRFVTREGVQGTFVINYDDANKFVSVERFSG